MGFIIFLIIFGFVCLVIFIVLSIGALFFGGEDPYERELARMDFEDEVLDRLDRRGGDKHYHITDARSIHLHKHETK